MVYEEKCRGINKKCSKNIRIKVIDSKIPDKKATLKLVSIILKKMRSNGQCLAGIL